MVQCSPYAHAHMKQTLSIVTHVTTPEKPRKHAELQHHPEQQRPTMNSIPAPADCENCVPTAEINGDGNTTTITHQPGCQHITKLRAQFEVQP